MRRVDDGHPREAAHSAQGQGVAALDGRMPSRRQRTQGSEIGPLGQPTPPPVPYNRRTRPPSTELVIELLNEVHPMGDSNGDAHDAPPAHTHLMAASLRGDLETINRLVASGADIDEANSAQETALTYAIAWNQADVVELLLENGADPEAPDGARWSPLMYAANEGNQVVVGALLKHGADGSRRDDHRRTASDIARDRGFDAVARMAAEGR